MPRPVGSSDAKPRSRKTKSLSPLLDHRLAAYALAAAAAAGVPAFSQGDSRAATGVVSNEPERNSIVYTPANISFVGNFDEGKVIGIDFTSEGVANITINVSGHYRISFGGSSTFAVGEAKWQQGSAMPHALAYGNHIGPSAKFRSGGVILYSAWSRAHDERVCWGAFRNTSSGYLGVRFSISGVTHYGWIALSANCGQGGKGGGTEVTGTITGYAYNKVPGEHINAGQTSSVSAEERQKTESSVAEPGTLGALSLGSVGAREK